MVRNKFENGSDRTLRHLSDLAVRAQGFEGDDQDTTHVEEEYEKISRNLVGSSDSVHRVLPVIRQRFESIREGLGRHNGTNDNRENVPSITPTGLSPVVSSPKPSQSLNSRDIMRFEGSGGNQRADDAALREELLFTAVKHHSEIEELRRKLTFLTADVQDMIESIHTTV